MLNILIVFILFVSSAHAEKACHCIAQDKYCGNDPLFCLGNNQAECDTLHTYGCLWDPVYIEVDPDNPSLSCACPVGTKNDEALSCIIDVDPDTVLPHETCPPCLFNNRTSHKCEVCADDNTIGECEPPKHRVCRSGEVTRCGAYYMPGNSPSTRHKCLACQLGYQCGVHGDYMGIGIKCDKGMYQDENYKDACKYCPDGTFTNDVGNIIGDEECIPCRPGEFCSQGDRYTCAPGTYVRLPQQNACLECPVGTTCIGGIKAWCKDGFSSKPGSTDCFYCGDGNWTEVTTIDNPEQGGKCIPCPPGSYCVDKIRTECPRGTYGDVEGMTTLEEACTQCHDGTFTNTTGNTECTEYSECAHAEYTIHLSEKTDVLCLDENPSCSDLDTYFTNYCIDVEEDTCTDLTTTTCTIGNKHTKVRCDELKIMYNKVKCCGGMTRYPSYPTINTTRTKRINPVACQNGKGVYWDRVGSGGQWNKIPLNHTNFDKLHTKECFTGTDEKDFDPQKIHPKETCNDTAIWIPDGCKQCPDGSMPMENKLVCEPCDYNGGDGTCCIDATTIYNDVTGNCEVCTGTSEIVIGNKCANPLTYYFPTVECSLLPTLSDILIRLSEFDIWLSLNRTISFPNETHTTHGGTIHPTMSPTSSPTLSPTTPAPTASPTSIDFTPDLLYYNHQCKEWSGDVDNKLGGTTRNVKTLLGCALECDYWNNNEIGVCNFFSYSRPTGDCKLYTSCDTPKKSFGGLNIWHTYTLLGYASIPTISHGYCSNDSCGTTNFNNWNSYENIDACYLVCKGQNSTYFAWQAEYNQCYCHAGKCENVDSNTGLTPYKILGVAECGAV